MDEGFRGAKACRNDRQADASNQMRKIYDVSLYEGMFKSSEWLCRSCPPNRKPGDADLAVAHLNGTAAAAQPLFDIAVAIKCLNGIKWS